MKFSDFCFKTQNKILSCFNFVKKAIYNTNDFVNKPVFYKKRVHSVFCIRCIFDIYTCKTDFVWIVHWSSTKNVDYEAFILAKLERAIQQVLSHCTGTAAGHRTCRENCRHPMRACSYTACKIANMYVTYSFIKSNLHLYIHLFISSYNLNNNLSIYH